jgi:CHASE3 domain sensor protein
LDEKSVARYGSPIEPITLWRSEKMEFPMEPKIFAILVAILFFLISLLISLIQRRRYRRQTDRLLGSEETTLNILNGLDTSLGKLESACTLEMDSAGSPKDIGRSVHAVRNQIKSSMTDIENNLRSFRAYRRKERAREKHRKHLEKIRKKRLGK